MATYGRGGRFTMTDRGRGALRQSRDTLTVGPSSLHWDGHSLTISIDEVSSPPIVSRVRGTITVTPTAITSVELPLTPDGAHVWRPFGPTSEIRVDLEAPGWQWQGHGYFDANFGTRALEADFRHWTWGRYAGATETHCFYDAIRRDGSVLAQAFSFDRKGSVTTMADTPPNGPLPRTAWMLSRETRCDAGSTPRQIRPMLDAPFYCRSAVETVIGGETVTGVHETLDLNRFSSPLLKPMLAVRVPRRPKWRFNRES